MEGGRVGKREEEKEGWMEGRREREGGNKGYLIL